MSENIFKYPDHCGPQLIPSTAFGSNVRALVSNKEWKSIRLEVLAKQGNYCKFCNATPSTLDCHEIWSYTWKTGETTGLQSLEDIYPLCKNCHGICHIGFWSLKGSVDHLERHMAKVRRMSIPDVKAEIANAFVVHDQLSKLNWELSVLKLSTYLKGSAT